MVFRLLWDWFINIVISMSVCIKADTEAHISQIAFGPLPSSEHADVAPPSADNQLGVKTMTAVSLPEVFI